MIQEKLRLLQTGKLTAEQNIKSFIDKIKKEDKNINSFIEVNKNAVQEAKELDKKKKKGRLFGLAIAVKSNICVKGLLTSCGSKTLSNFYSPYDADVIKKIKQEDGIIIGMVNMDEFACGSTGENSFYGPTKNPVALDRVPGGSSSGSAASVAADFCDLSLGSDTGGSIRTPASHCGIIGIKPSYGRVSRYGLIDLSMSLDQIGPLANNISDAFLVLDVIRGKDERDNMTKDYGKISLEKVRDIKVGVLKIKGVEDRIQNLIDMRINEICKNNGWKKKEININHIDLAVQTYYPLVYSEFFSATRRFDGRRYGKKIEKACGEEVLRRILGGSEITKAEFEGAYYEKALAVKKIIAEEFEQAFKEVDCIMLPTCPGLPWKLGEGMKMKIEEIYAYDALTIPANLGGICAISIPAGKIDGVPIGMQIICAKGKDARMLSIAKMTELIIH